MVGLSKLCTKVVLSLTKGECGVVGHKQQLLALTGSFRDAIAATVRVATTDLVAELRSTRATSNKSVHCHLLYP